MNYTSQRAFTLVELMAVVTIIAVIAVVAHPFVMNLLYSIESKRVEASFIDGLRQARVQSFIHKKDVVICTIDEHGVCRRGADTSLILFYDNNRNNKKDDEDTIIEQSAWRLKYGDILLRTSASRDYIRYMGDTSKPRGHIGHLQYCSISNNPEHSFKVVVNMYGGVRVERGRC